ncbi:MAG: hypothetical protein JJE53_02015 [Candidatus Pacebacteria bacterium]|nr:hypothetical protein [Candidatus Paceibacterota bacterium]
MESNWISLVIVCVTFLVILFVEKLLFLKLPSLKVLQDYQQRLDNLYKINNRLYKDPSKHDALVETLKERKNIKSLLLILLSFLFQMLLFIPELYEKLSEINIILICVAIVVLMTLGLIKFIKNSKKIVLASILVLALGLLLNYNIQKIWVMSLFTFLFISGFISIFTILIFLKKNNS